MHISKTALLFSTLLCLGATAVSAQQTYTIDPSTVSNATRQYWCDQQETQCPLICLQTAPGVPLENSCTASTLTYACVCSDGLAPNLTQYSQTMPYHICSTWQDQCVAGCGSDNQCAEACRADHPCGAQSPRRVNVTAPTSGNGGGQQDGGSGDGQVYTGFAGQDGAEGNAAVKTGVREGSVVALVIALGVAFGTAL